MLLLSSTSSFRIKEPGNALTPDSQRLWSVEMASSTPITDYSSPHVKHAIEVLWQDALRHLSSTNNEVLLPMDITNFIGPQNLEVIKSRLA